MATQNLAEEAATSTPTPILATTGAIIELAKEAVSAAVTNESTYQTNELGDYYYYDYSELEHHEEEAHKKYEEQLAKISDVLSGPSIGMDRQPLAPTLYINKYKIDESDLFIEDPQPWDPLASFLSFVVAKVYLVVPAFVVGVIFGMLIWSIYLVINKCISNSLKSKEVQPQLPGQEFLQLRETRGVSVQSSCVVVAGKQTLLKSKGPPSPPVIQGSSSTSSGVSSSSSTPVPFESASEGGRNQPSTNNSSLRSKGDLPEVLKAVDNLAQTVESAVVSARTPSSNVTHSSDVRRHYHDIP